jgi:amino acid adenylation domain-containing protein
MQANANSIPGRFAQIAAHHADRIAVSAPGGEWTYAELDQRSNVLAAQILDRMGKNSEPVVLLMEHDATLLAAILGVLKAGKIYLALDPGNPAERLSAMIADSRARLFLADKTNAVLAHSLAPEPLQVLEIADVFVTSSARMTFPDVSPAAGAWLMYTSGSTGTPKGVWQNHSGIINHTDVYSELIQLSRDDRLSLLTSCSLAASATPLFAALLNGATLCPFHVRSQGVERLAGWMRTQRISVYHSVPTVFRHLARAVGGKNPFENVRLIRLGGEPVLRSDVEVSRQLCPENCRLMHSYSSTETGLISALMIDRQTTLLGGRVPVGRAVRGVGTFLLDEQGQPVKSGGAGRIAVRSTYLSQGYWRQPDATAEKFSTDENNPQLRVFITGDLGKILPDGSLEHLGRVDQMVKIRGLGVDLGEVEATLLATGLVKEAAVAANEDSSGEKRLVAYLIPHAEADVSPQNCRRKLRQHLPEHMIPNDFVPLEKLPQTAAGKIDRRTLSLSPKNRPPPSRGSRPRDIVESQLARIWQSVLEIPRIGRYDDFFDLGGTSIQSAEVLARIEELYGASLSPSTLVEHSTLERLAGLVAGYVVIPSPSPLVTLRTADAGRPLFLVHSGQGDVTSYGLLVRRLPGRPIYGLQSVGLQGESWPLMGIPAMAQRYLREIVAKDPTGPYLLGATCMGGMVAFEMAQRLVRQGRKVGLLALFDVPCPLPIWQHHDLIERLYGPLRDPVRDGFRMLRWAIIRAAGLSRNPRVAIAYRRFVSHMNGRANRRYRPEFFPGTITLFNTVESKFPREDRRLLMRRYARETQVIALPGNRSGLFVPPAVDELARQLQSALALAEGKGRP